MHKKWHLLKTTNPLCFSALNDLLNLSLLLNFEKLFVYKNLETKSKLTAPLRPSTLGVLLPADLCNNKK